MSIKDTDGNSILSTAFSMRSGGMTQLNIKIDCVDGYSLLGEAVADVAVEAKHSADVGYTNIETTPYDLSSFDGTTQTFNIRLTAGTITSYTRRAFALTVART